MSFEEFENTLNNPVPPASSLYLQALWWDARGEWEKSHELIQDLNDNSAAWIHAYLHRKEGDIFNADYWYQRAGKNRSNQSLEEEWRIIAQAMIDQ